MLKKEIFPVSLSKSNFVLLLADLSSKRFHLKLYTTILQYLKISDHFIRKIKMKCLNLLVSTYATLIACNIFVTDFKRWNKVYKKIYKR